MYYGQPFLEISVPKGTLVIRAAELLGIEIPRFCYHDKLLLCGSLRESVYSGLYQRSTCFNKYLSKNRLVKISINRHGSIMKK